MPSPLHCRAQRKVAMAAADWLDPRSPAQTPTPHRRRRRGVFTPQAAASTARKPAAAPRAAARAGADPDPEPTAAAAALVFRRKNASLGGQGADAEGRT